MNVYQWLISHIYTVAIERVEVSISSVSSSSSTITSNASSKPVTKARVEIESSIEAQRKIVPIYIIRI